MNEISVIAAIILEPIVDEFYDVGLLQAKRHPFLTVSPDGFVHIKINESFVFACVEIKTRVAKEAHEMALDAVEKHGKIVHCSYNYEKFKTCVLFF